MLSLLLGLFLATAPGPCSSADTTVVCKCKQGSATACEALKQTDPKLAAELEKASAAASAAGQQHHVISRPIAEKLKQHATLSGRYTPRDPRFVARAADKAAHNGYQQWHRQVDEEVIHWLEANRQATPAQFEAFLRAIYARPEMLARFPHGF
jgi:hypothetical protein